MPQTLKIISGGQTGVDRGALDAALEAGVPCGGWCPDGRHDEHGRIPEHYPVEELPGGDNLARTVQNIRDSDGTLVIYFEDLQGGTAETVQHCIHLAKPFKLIDGSEVPVSRAVVLARAFVAKHSLRVLNVAGPRASEAPQAYAYARAVVAGVLSNEREHR